MRQQLEDRGVAPTPHRVAVLAAVRQSPAPVSAAEVLAALAPHEDINRVTVYRILDLFVKMGVCEKFSSPDRSFRYGAGHHVNTPDSGPDHPHFYCRLCRAMICLDTNGVTVDMEALARQLGGEVEKVEIRLDGVCRHCLLRKAHHDQ